MGAKGRLGLIRRGVAGSGLGMTLLCTWQVALPFHNRNGEGPRLTLLFLFNVGLLGDDRAVGLSKKRNKKQMAITNNSARSFTTCLHLQCSFVCTVPDPQKTLSLKLL